MNLVELLFDLYGSLNIPLKKVGTMHKLTSSQVICILSIPFDGISQTELAKKLGVDLSTLSRNLDKLIDKNIIIKTRSEHDSRSYSIFLTENGTEQHSQILLFLNNNLNDLNLELDYNDLENVINNITALHWALIKINQNFND